MEPDLEWRRRVYPKRYAALQDEVDRILMNEPLDAERRDFWREHKERLVMESAEKRRELGIVDLLDEVIGT